MDGVVLVLNQNYEPLNVCNLPRAFRLVFGEKAEVIEYDHQEIRTPRASYRAPSVIRLQYQIRRPRPRVKLTRREVFQRDRYACQYCGSQSHDLTLDHVLPRHRGGGHTWENLVTACKACNHRKGPRTPEEARVRLIRPPFEPRSDVYSLFTPYLADERNEAWRDYLFLGPELTRGAAMAGSPPTFDPGALPPPVLETLERLWGAGQAAYLVGGSLRDLLLGRPPWDWDFATDARPERVQAIFPGAIYENRFGTVVIRRAGDDYAITTFRSDHDYADHRRPHRVEFSDSIEADLARRDFTVNAMAWGRAGDRSGRGGEARPHSDRQPGPQLVDPYGGRADVAIRRLRAVGEAALRFEEDALRMIRAVRLAATLEFAIEPVTLDAIRVNAALAGHLSGERIATELERLLQAPTPSIGLRLMEETGLLAAISPELAAQRGVPQNKIAGEDLWDHTLRAVDATLPEHPVVRLAALLHDIGKPATAADGHFHDHEAIGADLAAAFLARLRMPRAVQERIAGLVRQHMFSYQATWSDAAVRRFIGRIGSTELEELFELREADNVGSGLPPNAGLLDELRRRVADQLEAHVALNLADLAIDGTDLLDLGVPAGPTLGRILDSLLDQVIADSSLNDRATLLLLAQSMIPDRP